MDMFVRSHVYGGGVFDVMKSVVNELLGKTIKDFQGLLNAKKASRRPYGHAVKSYTTLNSGASGPVQALAGDIVLCSLARHSTQVYKWVPASLMQGVTLRWTSIPSRGE